MTMFGFWPLLHDCIAGVIAALLLISGVGKASDPNGFASVVASYRLLPLGASIPVAWGLIVASLGVGAALLSGIAMMPAGIAAMVLFLVFMGAMGINLLRGRRDLECGCMPGKAETVSWAGVRAASNDVLMGAFVAFGVHAADWWMRCACAFLGLSAMLLALALDTLFKKPRPA